MTEAPRSPPMDAPSRTLLIVGACGAVVAAGFGALAGTGLRVPARIDAGGERASAPMQDVFMATAPAYPSWAPEPLYPRAERDPLADFAAAWDDAMVDAPRQATPVSYGPPADLPPPYVVRLEGEAVQPVARPGHPRPDNPQPGNPPPIERGGKAGA